MFKTLSITFLLLFSYVILSSMVSNGIPDPKDFSKKFISTIKLHDRDAYFTNFKIDSSDINCLKQFADTNPYLTLEEKNRILNDIVRSFNNTDQERSLNNNFNNIQIWLKEDSINLDEVEIIATFFEMHSVKELGFYLLEDFNLVLKYKSTFYKIYFEEAIYLNNEWKLGDVGRIYEVDPYLNIYLKKFKSSYDSAYTIYGGDMPIVLDSVSVDTSNPDESIKTNKLIKKQNKIQQKIDALYLKKESLTK